MFGLRGGSGGTRPPGGRGSGETVKALAVLRDRLLPELAKRLEPAAAAAMPRGDVAREAKAVVHEMMAH